MYLRRNPIQALHLIGKRYAAVFGMLSKIRVIKPFSVSNAAAPPVKSYAGHNNQYIAAGGLSLCRRLGDPVSLCVSAQRIAQSEVNRSRRLPFMSSTARRVESLFLTLIFRYTATFGCE